MIPALDDDVLSQFANDVEEGLTARQKNISPKYFYDDYGSKLFEQICTQPEYYPTRTEYDIIKDNVDTIVEIYANSEISLIELGSGNSKKTRIILERFLEKKKDSVYYFPIDVSKDILQETSFELNTEFPKLNTRYIPAEYIDGIVQVKKLIDKNNYIPKKGIILFLGSSLGNLEPTYAIDFLKNIKKNITQIDLLLIGLDLHKDKQILEKAYNDKAGATAKFNLNVLKRINKELSGEFDLNQFEHFAFYNKEQGRIEMHLKSLQEQNVKINYLDRVFYFSKNETIHTENSYKYSIGDLKDLFFKSGFTINKMFTDKNNWFSLSLLKPITN
ncbi:MAG: L-histidine N(alpha)-methyltransferase [Nitrososphaeraceae archaeon]